MADDPLSALELIRNRAALAYASPGRMAESAADAPLLLAVVDKVLKLHRPHRLYDECDHEHTEEEVEAGLAADAGEFFACEDGFERVVCCHCCASDGNGQTEDCAVDHLADECWPCPTVQVITSALLGEAAS